jgi:hypothetical protein
MTPKEKAEELFNKYATYVVMWAGDVNTTHQNCKQCALIAVDEILDVIGEYIIEPMIFDIEYWQEVKQEIEKL